MPRRKANSIRRRSKTGDLTPEAIEVLIFGDVEGGALIPNHPDRARPFTNEAEARACWSRHSDTVIRVFRGRWDSSLGMPTLAIDVGMSAKPPWGGQPAPWAETKFGLESK